MRRYHIHIPGHIYAATAYGRSKRDALNKFRDNWFPDRQRLPRGTAIWES